MTPRRFELSSFTPPPGITLIEASAGTGKTHNITHIICNLIASGQCRIDEVLVLTFTEKATQELRDRTRKALAQGIDLHTQLGNQRELTALSDALDQFDSAAIFTIHGFCNRILREFSVEAGLSPEFAILKDQRIFEDQLEIAVARDIQSIATQNPWIALGIHALELKSNFIGNALALKESEDLLSLPHQASPVAVLKQWFTAEFANLQQAWKQERIGIRKELLSDDAPVKRSSNAYKPLYLEPFFDRMDQVFEGQPAPLGLLKELLPFAESTLTEKLRKGRSLQPFTFYQHVEALHSALDSLSGTLIERILELRTEQVKRMVYEEQTLRFDELLTLSRHIVCAADGRFASRLYHAYPFALVDEFQDTDPIQFAILDRIFLQPTDGQLARPLILIGDPKQAIYSFRGGDIFTYGAAKQRAQHIYFLDTNWRSSPAVNEAVNELLRGCPAPFHFEWIDYQPVRSAEKNRQSCLVRHAATLKECTQTSGIDWVAIEPHVDGTTSLQRAASDIQQLLAEPHYLRTEKGLRRLGPDAIAVLVPDNQNGARMHEELGKCGVASSIFGGASVFQTQEALQLFAILHAMHRPRDLKLVRGAVTSACFDPTLFAASDSITDARWTRVLREFATASQLWKLRGLSAAMVHLEQQFEWKVQLSRSPEPHRALANHTHVRQILLTQEAAAGEDPALLLQWMQDQINEPDRTDLEQLLQLDSDAAAVTILTMHKSKGLEFPLVFLPVLPHRRPKSTTFPLQFHDPSTGKLRTSLTRTLATDSDRSNFEAEFLGEALRTLYVAITRAQVLCKVYLDADKHLDSVADVWLPDAGDLQSRIAQLQHRAVSETAHPSDAVQALHSKQPATTSPPWIAPDSAPTAPDPLAHLSFTGIVHGTLDADRLDSDEPTLFSYRSAPVTAEPATILSIADFDRGTHAGLMFHDLLEQIDYSESTHWPRHLEACLRRYGYDPAIWSPVLLPWLDSLINTPVIMPDGRSLVLSDMGPTQCFRETEFSVATSWGTHTWQEMQALFSSSTWVNQLPYSLPDTTMNLKQSDAFLNGVVDCWCRVDGRVYLIDWKSNYLGSNPDAYTAAAMADSMRDHHYHLQYLLYLCAINRYLRQIDPNYDYGTDFGGVGYAYLRGIQTKVENTGWFTTLPPSELIDALEQLLPSSHPTNHGGRV